MIEEFKTDVVADMQADSMSLLGGIQSFVKGDVYPSVSDLPAVTVDHIGNGSIKDTGNHIEMTTQFVVVLYVANLRGGYQAAVAAANNLLMRYEGGQYRGLIRYLHRLKGWSDSSGQNWKIKVVDGPSQANVKSEQAKFASVASSFVLEAMTMFDKSKF